MKLLYLHQYFKTPDMAGGTRSYEFARRLVKQGHEVHIITSWTGRTDKHGWFEEVIDGVHVHWLPVPYSNHMGFSKRLKAFISFALRAGPRARSIGGDLVFATSTPLTIAIPGVNAAHALNVPLVFEVRDLWPEMPIATGTLRNPFLKILARRLEKYAYQNAEHIVALSPGMRSGVLKICPDAKTTLIPNSCDFELFDSPPTSSNSFLEQHPELKGRQIVSYSGTFGQVNAVDYLPRIAAASANRGSNICYVAIGDGSRRDFIEEQAKKLGVLGENFFMYPKISKRDIPELMKATSLPLSLFADVEEMQSNSANKFFDALASGNAVGINYVGWQADIIRSHDLGVILPPDDPDAAAATLIEFLSKPELLAEAGSRAREVGAEFFSRDLLASRLELVLAETLSASVSVA